MINAIRGSVQDQQKIREGERNINLDVLRSIAIFCVIMTHEAQAAFPFINNIDKFFSAPLKIKLLGLALHTLGRCGVPVFFFLTGYLVMTKRFNNTDDIVQFWKTHLMPLTITCAIWGIIYYFYGIILEGNSFSVTRILRELLYYQNYEGIQFWYIPHIIGVKF